MLRLPFEILKIIFSHLSTSDLLECQLTNKNWYEASVEYLYSKIEVNTDNKSFKLSRTLSNSNWLGNYVHNISCNIWFTREYEEVYWDEHRLLNKLIRRCPNISVIETHGSDLSIWIRFSQAAHQGQLSRLRVLPYPSSRSLESYIYTALLYKSSLTTLTIIDSQRFFGTDLNHLEEYQTLKGQLGEFQNLQMLELDYHSDKRLSHFDAMIEDCPYLKIIIFDVFNPSERPEEIIEFEGVVNPRPDIHKLTCNGMMIDNGGELRYIIQKFPNLKTLELLDDDCDLAERTNYRADDIKEFLRFAMDIPDFTMHDVYINKRYLAKVWIGLDKTKERVKNVAIRYNPGFPERVKLTLRPKTTIIDFIHAYEDNVEMPHIKFFSEVGSMITSLQLLDIDPINEIPLYVSNGLVQVFEILKLCPSLQELTVLAHQLDPDNYEKSSLSQHPQVRKVSIHGLSFWLNSRIFFEPLSFSFPNLKVLRLGYAKEGPGDSGVIFMPRNRLDLIVLEDFHFLIRHEVNTLNLFSY